MNRKRRNKMAKQLDDLYKSIPVTIKCQGLCQESCGPIALTDVEFDRIADASKITPCTDENGTCSILKSGKCSAYSVRPVICRLWGITKGMECPFGCVPTPRYLTKKEGHEFLRKADAITKNGFTKSTLPEMENVLNAIPRQR